MRYPSSELVIDPVLIRKHDVSGPRYTSYPTADRFVEAYGEGSLRHRLGERVGLGAGATLSPALSPPLSLYVHLPFCDTVCYYCGCNKVVTRDHGKSAKYINSLGREMALVAEAMAGEADGEEGGAGGADAAPRAPQRYTQLHWGGGTPTFLAREEMGELLALIDARFERAAGAELSLEVDPRRVEPGRMAYLAQIGFNRLSVGVQDFDARVQQAVHRIQSEEETRRVIDEARASGFGSVNLDLIYGLPLQTLDSFNATLDKVIDIAPDRIALYSYAHLPALFMPQRRIHAAELPSPEAKLQILTLAIGRLTGAGYVYIGMDHFARPDDELAVAQSQGRLQRNFQGYSTQAGSDMLGFGVSAIGRVGPSYYQNVKSLPAYYDAIDAGRLPVWRGIELTADDLVRRAVIQALICNFRLSIESIELSWLVDFRRYFASEMADLQRLADDGLVELEPDWIVVTPRGRLLVRAVCMVFDPYLRAQRERARYSKVI
jgi:oxygen-independent coproporphyrinogen-3 oxidase